MSGILPTVFSGSTALYPVQRSWTQDVWVSKSYAGTEQRAKRRGALGGLTLTYTNISTADKLKLDNFINAQKGAFDSSWVMDLNANPLPQNGNFIYGLTGWQLANDSYGLLIPSVYVNTLDTSEDASAYLYNQAILLGAFATASTNFNTTTPIPCSYGQSIYISYETAIATNSQLPATVVPTSDILINFVDANGAYVTTASVSNGYGLIPVPAANAVGAIFYLVCHLTSKQELPAQIPFNSVAFELGAVRMIVTGNPGTYTGCAFDQDEFAWTQTKDFANRWSTTIKVRQTLPYTPPVKSLYPANGNFANGLAGWETYNDNYNGFIFGCDKTFTRRGENDAYAYNAATPMASGERHVCTFASSKIPAVTGQTISATFWSLIGYNATEPYEVEVGIEGLFVNCYDAYGNQISSFFTGFSRAQIGGWGQSTVSFQVLTPGVKQIGLFFAGFIANNYALPQNVPVNCVVVAIGDVSVTVANQSVFPSVRPSIVTGFPYTPAYHFYTDRNDLPTGTRVSYAWYGSGLSNFPNRALQGWGLSFTSASDAELALIENHFIACGGKYLPFTFTDPDTGIVYPNVRYDMDSFDIQHKMVNNNDFKVTLAEFWTAN